MRRTVTLLAALACAITAASVSHAQTASAPLAVVFVDGARAGQWDAIGIAPGTFALQPLGFSVDSARPTFVSRHDRAPRLSRDGRWLAYALRGRLHVRDLVAGTDRGVTTEGPLQDLFGFAADSSALSFVDRAQRIFSITDGTSRSAGTFLSTDRVAVLETGASLLLASTDPDPPATTSLVRRTLGAGGHDDALWARQGNGFLQVDEIGSRIAYVSAEGVEVADDPAPSRVVLAGQWQWRFPRLSPSARALVAVHTEEIPAPGGGMPSVAASVVVVDLASGQSRVVYHCAVAVCVAGFVGESDVLVHDDTVVHRVSLDGATTDLDTDVRVLALPGATLR